jgi:hypothetical protein
MRALAIAFAGSLAFAAATTMLACGSRRLPAPSYVGQPQEALVQVPYPPPPARVEFVPDQPDDHAVWIDGEWVWQGRRYAWKPGRWVKPPANASFAPWSAVRDTMGSLYVAEGSWRDSKGNEVAAPAPLKIGKPSPGAITDPEGDTLAASAERAADASTTQPDGSITEETRAPRELIIDGGLPIPFDGSIIPDAAGFDATFDAEPVRIRRP